MYKVILGAVLLSGLAIWQTAHVAVSAQATPSSLYLALSHGLETAVSTPVLLLDQSRPYSPWFDLSDTVDFERGRTHAETAVSANWITHDLADSIDSLVPDILRDAEWGRTPFKPEEAKDFETLTNELFARTETGWIDKAAYVTYKTSRSDYLTVDREYQSTPPAQRSTELKSRWRRARETYFQEAQGPTYAEYERRLLSLLRYDTAKSLRAQLQNTFEANKDAADRPRVDLNPQIGPVDAGWRSVEVEVDPSAPESNPPFGYVPPDLPTGFGTIREGTRTPLPSPPIVRLAFEIAAVNILRPSLDASIVFESRSWRWTRPLLSDGVIPERASDDTTMAPPFRGLPVTLVFLRNLRVRVNQWPAETLRALKSPDGAVRLGPLALAGTFGADAERVELRTVPLGNSEILIPSVQLVGLVMQRQPKTPDPKSDLLWDRLPDLPLVPTP